MAKPPCRELDQLLDRIQSAAREHPRTSLRAVVDAIGIRSFAPILLFAGLVMLAPLIGDIPGVPVLMGIVVILVAGQLLLRRERVWLPEWLLERSIASGKVTTAIAWSRRPARFIDRWTQPRLRWAVRHAATPVIAIVCVILAAATPLMEVIPFSANIAGLAITAFGLALVTEDGLIGLGAMAVSISGLALLVFGMF
jgi:hypothetical protein